MGIGDRVASEVGRGERVVTNSGRKSHRSLGTWIAVPLLAIAGVASVEASGSASRVVLGSRHFAGPSGRGFGTVKPRKIFNGGDASGLIKKIHWRHWGSSVARGRGLHPIFRPRGGYYSKPSHSHLRAYDLGHCGRSHRLAYRKLKVKDQRRPGGSYRNWYSWSGFPTICKGFG